MGNEVTPQPLVSVCIPAYNNEDTIAETIQSVLEQTYDNIELIIVDDHSTDRTLEEAESASRNKINTQVFLYRNNQNLGMAGNWNRCLSLCHGKYIKLLCGDDLIEKNLVSREVAILEVNPEAVMVSSDTKFIDMQDNPKTEYKRYHKSGLVDGREISRYSIFHRDYLGAPLANTFRKSAYEITGGFDPSFHYVIDYDFYMTLACQGYVYILHEPLNFFRLREDSNTGMVLGGSEGDAYVKEHEHLARKHAAALGLSESDIRRSVCIRKAMNRLGRLYLKVFMK